MISFKFSDDPVDQIRLEELSTLLAEMHKRFLPSRILRDLKQDGVVPENVMEYRPSFVLATAFNTLRDYVEERAAELGRERRAETRAVGHS